MLELCLVIAACHLTETYGGEPFNYEMVFKGKVEGKAKCSCFHPFNITSLFIC